MKYFWTHRDNIPDGYGYGQFTPAHFVWLVLTVLFTAAVTVIYKGAGTAERILILRVIGAALIFIDVVKMILIARSDVKLSEYLPLELCSFGAYFIVCDSIVPDNAVFGQMLLTLFLPAAIMAVIFPTTQALPSFNFYTIHQFLYHGLIISYVIARFASGEIPNTYAGVWPSILKIILLAAVIYVIDTVFDKNFMFLRDTYGNPMLEAIRKTAGDGFAYTIGLVCFCIIVIHIFYLFFRFISFLFL
ncbi:MAG: YwaF family protein [Solobacterium sp.]|nr:YwaF family protein [Solobacterium sp.]